MTLLLNGVTDQQLGVSIMFGARVTDVRVVDGVTQIKARVPDIFTNMVIY